jgi:hypothetical protein
VVFWFLPLKQAHSGQSGLHGSGCQFTGPGDGHYNSVTTGSLTPKVITWNRTIAMCKCIPKGSPPKNNNKIQQKAKKDPKGRTFRGILRVHIDKFQSFPWTMDSSIPAFPSLCSSMVSPGSHFSTKLFHQREPHATLRTQLPRTWDINGLISSKRVFSVDVSCIKRSILFSGCNNQVNNDYRNIRKDITHIHHLTSAIITFLHFLGVTPLKLPVK